MLSYLIYKVYKIRSMCKLALKPLEDYYGFQHGKEAKR